MKFFECKQLITDKMISNGTYLMILGVFLIVIVLFLVAVFFYLRKTTRCSKPFGRISDSVTEEKRRNEPQAGSASLGTLRATNLEGQLEQVSISIHIIDMEEVPKF